MINKKDDLVQFIREASQELYAEPGEEPLLVKDAQSSVDNQIDAFLIKFEENSQLDPGWDKEMEDVLSESLLNLSLKIFLYCLYEPFIIIISSIDYFVFMIYYCNDITSR